MHLYSPIAVGRVRLGKVFKMVGGAAQDGGGAVRRKRAGPRRVGNFLEGNLHGCYVTSLFCYLDSPFDSNNCRYLMFNGTCYSEIVCRQWHESRTLSSKVT